MQCIVTFFTLIILLCTEPYQSVLLGVITSSSACNSAYSVVYLSDICLSHLCSPLKPTFSRGGKWRVAYGLWGEGLVWLGSGMSASCKLWV